VCFVLISITYCTRILLSTTDLTRSPFSRRQTTNKQHTRHAFMPPIRSATPSPWMSGCTRVASYPELLKWTFRHCRLPHVCHRRGSGSSQVRSPDGTGGGQSCKKLSLQYFAAIAVNLMVTMIANERTTTTTTNIFYCVSLQTQNLLRQT